MATNITINLRLSDADQAVFDGLSFADKRTWQIAKQAAQLAPQLLATLASGLDILALLQPDDRLAVQNLIAAVKAMPEGQ